MEIRLFRNPKGRKPTPSRVVTLDKKNVRLAIRQARRELKTDWAALDLADQRDDTTRLQAGVYNEQGHLEWQAHIDSESSLNGARRMVVEEER